MTAMVDAEAVRVRADELRGRGMNHPTGVRRRGTFAFPKRSFSRASEERCGWGVPQIRTGTVTVMEHGHIGEAIRKARERRGITQGQLAAQLRNAVHPKTVGKWERGQSTPQGQLPALEAVLGPLTDDDGEAPTAAGLGPGQMSDAELAGALMTFAAEAARRLITPANGATDGG